MEIVRRILLLRAPPVVLPLLAETILILLPLERGLSETGRWTRLRKTGERENQQTLENHGRPTYRYARQLWAKAGRVCSPRSHQRLWKNPKASVCVPAAAAPPDPRGHESAPNGYRPGARERAGAGAGHHGVFFAGSHGTSLVRAARRAWRRGAGSRCRAGEWPWTATGRLLLMWMRSGHYFLFTARHGSLDDRHSVVLARISVWHQLSHALLSSDRGRGLRPRPVSRRREPEQLEALEP